MRRGSQHSASEPARDRASTRYSTPVMSPQPLRLVTPPESSPDTQEDTPELTQEVEAASERKLSRTSNLSFLNLDYQPSKKRRRTHAMKRFKRNVLKWSSARGKRLAPVDAPRETPSIDLNDDLSEDYDNKKPVPTVDSSSDDDVMKGKPLHPHLKRMKAPSKRQKIRNA